VGREVVVWWCRGVVRGGNGGCRRRGGRGRVGRGRGGGGGGGDTFGGTFGVEYNGQGGREARAGQVNRRRGL